MNKTKTIIGILLLIVVGAVATIIISCSDNENAQIVSKGNLYKKTLNGEDYIAKYNIKEKSFDFNIDVDEFKKAFEDSIKAKYNKIASVEDFFVVDSLPEDPNYVGIIELSYYSIDDDITVRTAFILSKEKKDGEIIYYTAKPAKVQCISSKCGEGQCIFKTDHGVPYDCTSCPNECKKIIATDDSGGVTMAEVRDWAEIAWGIIKIVAKLR